MAITGEEDRQWMVQKQLQELQKFANDKDQEARHWKNVATERLTAFFQSIRPSEDDIVLFKIPVGNMPAHEISDYVSSFASQLDDKRTDGGFLPFEVFWLPYRSDGTGPNIELLSPNEDDILIIKVPVGNVSAAEAKRIVNETRSKFTIRHPKISHVIWLPKRDTEEFDFSLVSESDMEDMGWVRK